MSSGLGKPLRACAPGQGVRLVTTPWGSRLRVPPDALGDELRRSAIHELAASELMERLVEPGDQAVDAGANAGYFTTLLAARVGANGRVLAIEAHPRVADDPRA